ncbi:RNA polymerase sigma factor [Solirubrobacter soli]|uniref:RNA polymerase sigma factor n=1 Tax=Solirubrobacter soli TaxID=363832 RepID=UPI0004863F5A
MLAATVRVTRDLDAAEDAVQDAYLSALTAWERDGVPSRPGAWLTTAARRTALNALERRKTLETKLPLLLEAEAEPVDTEDFIPDDRLRLVFTCCHPALSREAQVALTLRLVCGVTTPDIAGAFLVSEPTMAARLTRAKKKIAAAGIPYVVPADLAPRLDAVLAVVYLLATTGHTAPSGEHLARADLAERALDLARMLRLLLPDEREVAGLLALLLLLRARAATRDDVLSQQNRSEWDRALIAEADALIVAALQAGPPGRFTLQAAIAGLHAAAESYETTDWPQLLILYDLLLHVWPSPVVALNRAVVVAEVHGPEAALETVDAIEGLDTYRYLWSTRADLLRRLDRHEEAGAAYREALRLTENSTERAFLEARL